MGIELRDSELSAAREVREAAGRRRRARRGTGRPAPPGAPITDGGPLGLKILARSNSGTHGTFYPVTSASKSADASASTLTELPSLAERLVVSAAQANAGSIVTVTAVTDES